MNQTFRALAFVAALAFAGAAGAQTATPAIPDLKGTWVGKGEAIVDGPAAHHPPGAPARPAAPFRLREETYTVSIVGQDGRRLWGTVSSSQSASERLIGSLATDNKTVYFAVGPGYVDGVVTDANTMEICYRHVLPGSAVVGCNQLVRQK
jgi:hypothetical protein